MSALLLVAVYAVAQPPGDRGAGADRDRGTATAGGRMEGTWTVVAAERQGRPLPGGRTVTFRNGMLMFDAAGGSGAGGTGSGGTGTGSGTGGTGPAGGQGAGGAGTGAGAGDFASLPSLRLDFSPTGTVRVTESGTAGGTGDRTAGTGDRAGGTPTGDRPGAPTGSGTGAGRTGVFVMTQEYLAISVMDDVGGSGGGRTGGTGTPGSGGTGAPGGSTSGGSGGSGSGSAGAGRAGGGAVDNTTSRPYLTLILRRTSGATGAGGDRR